jgi:hypothetical protein
VGLAERPQSENERRAARRRCGARQDRIAADQPLELQVRARVRHVGPMAQDFYTAFKVGEDDKHITSIDEDGVALAAIKALHHDNTRLHAHVASLDVENARLRRRLAAEEAHDRRVDVELAHIVAVLRK